MEEETINLRDYIQVLLRRKYLILLVFVICMPFVVMQMFSHTPVYRAEGKLLVQRNQDPALLTNVGFRYDPGFLQTQIQIIKSGKVAENVVRDLNLTETFQQYFPEGQSKPSFRQRITMQIRNIYQTALKFAGVNNNPPPHAEAGGKPLSEEEMQEMRVKSMGKMISSGLAVNPTREESDIISISYVSPNPVFAEKIVNSVASGYKYYLLEMQMASTEEVITWMKNNAAAQREMLEASEKVLQAYVKKHNLYMLGDKDAIFPSRISEFSSRLTRAQADVNELESLYQEITRISPRQALSLPVIAEHDIIRNLRQKIISQEQEIDGLSKALGEKHPQMIRAQRDLAALNEQLTEEISTVIQSVQNQYELARERARSIERLLNETKFEAATMSDQLFQYEILNRDVEVNRLLYDRLISRIKEYGATENKQTIDVWEVEKAATPSFPMNQRPKRTLILGLVVSLMAGVGLAFFLEHLDNTVKTAEDAEARLDIPVVGMIPFFKDKTYSVEKIIHELPHSEVAERYRAIRTALLLSVSESRPYSLLIASMVQKTGKTVTACNLALALAQSGRRVLLIDADMRRPKIHKIFKMDNTYGLSSYLDSKTDLIPQKSQESSFLDILTSGPIPSNPSELLSSFKFESLVGKLADKYDFVVFDSPPMADVTDPVLISKVTTSTLLIVRSGVSTYDSVKQADKSFKSINVDLLGQIINAVDEKKHSYYHYKYYGTSGGYYSDAKSSDS